MRPAVLLALAILAASARAQTPDTLFGHYRSAPKRVCVGDANRGAPVCSRIADTMLIQHSGTDRRDAKVRAEFTLPDSRICGFEGTGSWIAAEKRLLVTDGSTDCQLSLVVAGRELRSFVVRPEQCSSPCAGSGLLEGVVMRKR